MKNEKIQYQLVSLYSLNQKNFPVNKDFEMLQIEKCNHYIKEYGSLVEKFWTQDILTSIPFNEFDKNLKPIENICLDFMEKEDYTTLCNAVSNLNKWKELRKKLNSSHSSAAETCAELDSVCQTRALLRIV